VFDYKTRDLEEAVADAKCTLEELNESGDLEERMEASFAVEEAERRLISHLLSDPQEDKPETIIPMSQDARNNPDKSPRHEDFGGGAFSSQADCFRSAKSAPTPTEAEVREAVERLFAYLDYVRPDAPRNAIDPYQVSTSGSYSFQDLRLIRDALQAAQADTARMLNVARGCHDYGGGLSRHKRGRDIPSWNPNCYSSTTGCG